MKKCTWCGKEYGEELERCLVDGQPLAGRFDASVQPRSAEPDMADDAVPLPIRPNHRRPGSPPPGKWLHLDSMEAAFFWEEGYSRPDWKLIRAAIEQKVAQENLSDAWTEAVLSWLEQLRQDLGGEYQVRALGEFVLLSTLPPKAADELLAFSNQTLEQLYTWLREAAWQWGNGKHVILLFADQEDYYQYVAYYYREGVHPASGGCLIHRDYVHIALPYNAGRYVRRTLAHELVHNSVVHLPLPLWLNEGMAVAFERGGGGELQRHVLDQDLRERHFAFWNRANIQKFWAGVSFGEAGDSNELSYSLAEILLHLLAERSTHLPVFIKTARWEDAGQTAALDILAVDLGQVAATFLGPGDWRPNRKAIAEHHTAARRR